MANLRQRFVEQGLEAALKRKPRLCGPRKRICDGEAEAKLIATRCGEPPLGYSRWSCLDRRISDRETLEQETTA